MNSSSYGTVSGGGKYTSGTSVTVKATPNTGYEFKEWQKDGATVSTSASYTFKVSGDCTLLAVFEEEPTAAKIIWATTTDSNGITTLTGYNETGATPSGNLVIPSKVGGKTISAIGENFLKDNRYITSLTIPGTVQTIGKSAFNGCVGLETVTVQEGVKTIDQRAFYGCTSLKTVIIQEGVTAIYSFAFQNCTSLVTISLPETLTTLGHEGCYSNIYYLDSNNVFAGCTSLKQIKLPSNLTYIAANNFEGCTALEKIYIPAAVTRICDSAFKDCRSLKAVYYGSDETDWGKIEVRSKNDYLSSVEHVYFNRTGF